jgi:hypothetical protein
MPEGERLEIAQVAIDLLCMITNGTKMWSAVDDLRSWIGGGQVVRGYSVTSEGKLSVTFLRDAEEAAALYNRTLIKPI